MTDIGCAENTDTRTCACHPDDKPPVPCPRKYALTDCRIAALLAAVSALTTEITTNQVLMDNISLGKLEAVLEAEESLDRFR